MYLQNIPIHTLKEYCESLKVNANVRSWKLASTRSNDAVAFAIADMLKVRWFVADDNVWPIIIDNLKMNLFKIELILKHILQNAVMICKVIYKVLQLFLCISPVCVKSCYSSLNRAEFRKEILQWCDTSFAAVVVTLLLIKSRKLCEPV